MNKYSQDTSAPASAPTAPPAGGGGVDAGAVPDSSGGGGSIGASPLGGLPPLPGGDGAAPAAGAPADDPNDDSKIFYKAIGTAQDIVNDYNLVRALNTGKSIEQISQDIWTEYGGEDDGLNVKPGCTGTRSPDEKLTDPEEMNKRNKATDKKKWMRLEIGKKINDIFEDQMQVLKLVLNFAASEVKAKKPATSSASSWYRYARFKD